jgi:hypothetical protein
MRRSVLSVVLLAMGLAAGPAAAEKAPTPAVVFQQFHELAGTWVGKSTRGWEEEVTIRSIAGGSVVEVSSFDAHPGEEMRTLMHMDGERLVLTHYCVAQNQPRLAATSIEDGGRTITFTFQDATNLPSRDKGHMDKAVYRFHEDGHFSSRWTWYQDGEERWMEEIQYRRVPSDDS